MAGLWDKLKKVVKDPLSYAWVPETLVARARGELLRRIWPLMTRGRVQIGPGFVAECALHVEGPGRVIIGAGSRIRRSSGYEVTIVTLLPDAVVELGEGASVGGLRIRCADRVTIGRHFLAAKCTITDVDVGRLAPDRGPRPITIGDDCFLGIETTVLGGARLGNDVVVSGGSVVTREMAGHSFAMGNPARPMRGMVQKGAHAS